MLTPTPAKVREGSLVVLQVPKAQKPFIHQPLLSCRRFWRPSDYSQEESLYSSEFPLSYLWVDAKWSAWGRKQESSMCVAQKQREKPASP